MFVILLLLAYLSNSNFDAIAKAIFNQYPASLIPNHSRDFDFKNFYIDSAIIINPTYCFNSVMIILSGELLQRYLMINVMIRYIKPMHLAIPGFGSNLCSNNALVFAKYDYRYIDGHHVVDGQFDVLYREIYCAILESCKAMDNLYKLGSKKLKSIIDDIINSKKKQAYLMHYAILNHDKNTIKQMSDSLAALRTPAMEYLLDDHVLNLHKNEIDNIDFQKYRNELGKQKCYMISYVIVNSKKIADNIVDYTNGYHQLARATQSAKEAFNQAASKYASVKKISDEHVSDEDLRRMFGQSIMNEIDAMKYDEQCIAPIQLNDNKFITIFIENASEQEYSDSHILDHVKKQILSQYIKEAMEYIIENGEMRQIDINNVSNLRSDNIVFSIDCAHIKATLTVNDVFKQLKLFNINEQQFLSIPAIYKNKVFMILFDIALASIVRRFIANRDNLIVTWHNEFDGYLRYLWNKECDKIMQDHCNSIIVSDEQLIDIYKDMVNCKKVDGYAIFCDSKNILDNLNSKVNKMFDSSDDFASRKDGFIELAKNYTTSATHVFNATFNSVNELSNKWLDNNGAVVNPQDFIAGRVYFATLHGAGFCMLFVENISQQKTNQALLSDLRKKYIQNELEQLLLRISVLSVNGATISS